MEFVIYPTVLFVCFFILYILCRHDFVLLRQNISLSQIFDALFISLISSFLLGRAFFMVNSLSSDLLSLLRFFHIVKFPGIALGGVFIGVYLSLSIIFMKKKGLLRILDIFTISFSPLLLANLLMLHAINASIVFLILTIVVSFFVFVFFLSSHNKYILRDGSVTILYIILLALATFIIDQIGDTDKKLIYNFSLLQVMSIVEIPIGIIFFVLNQKRKNS